MALTWMQLVSNTGKNPTYIIWKDSAYHLPGQKNNTSGQWQLCPAKSWKPSDPEMSLHLCSSAALQWINPHCAHTFPESLCCSLWPLPSVVPPVSTKSEGHQSHFHWLRKLQVFLTVPCQPPPHVQLSVSPPSHKAPALSERGSSESSVLPRAFPQQSEFGKACLGKCTVSTILFPRVTFLDLSHFILALLLQSMY